METVPIFTYIPPSQYYDELRIDPTLLVDKFIGLVERLYGSLSPVGGLHDNCISFCRWICEIIKNENISAVYIFGSSVYRMDNPNDISDIDMLIVGDIWNIEINIPSELKGILHVQTVSPRGTLFMHHICGLSQQLLALKTNEDGERLIKRAREIFNEHYLFELILRDVYKVCATKRISELNMELKEKIERMRLNPNQEEQNPYFVRTMLKQRPDGIEEGELLTLLDFSFKRRRVKQEYREEIKEKAKQFWKTGRL
ncbi:MAG: hypothetical protein ACP5KP_02090 [Candidatus Micrarchaeia archaeon]